MGFQQGLSGLNASSKNLDVIGNNIANANTYGAKTSRAEFSHVYAVTAGGIGQSIGTGVSVDAVTQQFTQGNVSTTDVPTDLAISGNGFFQVTDGINPTMYTRNGQFKVDRSGFVVNNDGMKLLGYKADTRGQIQPSAAEPLRLPSSGIVPRISAKISMEVNLDSRAAIPTAATTAPPTIDFSDPSTYNNATSQTLYDAKGQSVAMTYYFQKASTDVTTGASTWNVYATANGTPVNGTAAAPESLATLTFNGAGRLDSSFKTVDAATNMIEIPSTTTSTGVLTGAISIDPAQFDIAGITQYGSSFAVTKLDQDGYPPGNLSGISVQDNGTVLAQYSNGQSLAAGQIELASFRNPQGLQPMAGNMWAITQAAGEPVRGTPGSGTLGKLEAGALEESNVDLAGELVNMITAQRAYQANAQTIKTQDQVLQTLVNLR
ncbi:flagellar hook protein FlgE [Azohydromonas aeria]|uniref:flagellar hook protein FlgE n=1 Tax=Azohydromonas aeria TaxID=2590212 RepID=UPI0012FB1E64|nr:flagellar hook protein FlgE [Azohydromonas aeria]